MAVEAVVEVAAVGIRKMIVEVGVAGFHKTAVDPVETAGIHKMAVEAVAEVVAVGIRKMVVVVEAVGIHMKAIEATEAAVVVADTRKIAAVVHKFALAVHNYRNHIRMMASVVHKTEAANWIGFVMADKLVVVDCRLVAENMFGAADMIVAENRIDKADKAEKVDKIVVVVDIVEAAGKIVAVVDMFVAVDCKSFEIDKHFEVDTN